MRPQATGLKDARTTLLRAWKEARKGAVESKVEEAGQVTATHPGHGGHEHSAFLLCTFMPHSSSWQHRCLIERKTALRGQAATRPAAHYQAALAPACWRPCSWDGAKETAPAPQPALAPTAARKLSSGGRARVCREQLQHTRPGWRQETSSLHGLFNCVY